MVVLPEGYGKSCEGRGRETCRGEPRDPARSLCETLDRHESTEGNRP